MELVLAFAFLLTVIPVLVLVIDRPEAKGSPPNVSLSSRYRGTVLASSGSSKEIAAFGRDLRDLHGNIFTFPLGKIRFTVFNTCKLIKEVCKLSAFFGRPSAGFSTLYFGGDVRGIGLQDDENKWSEIRNFTFRKLKEHGTDKNSMDVISLNEATKLIEQISKNHLNQLVDTSDLICIPMINVLWKIIAGERFDFDDQEIIRVHQIFSDFISFREKKTTLVFTLIWILGSISDKLVFWVKLLKPVKTLRQFFIKYSKSSKAAYKDGEVKNFTDAFIQKIYETTNPASMFFGNVGDENLAATVFELVSVGAKSSRISLQWILLYMAAHPEKQQEMQQEIDTVLGSRLPCFADRMKMPYTTAVIMETSRIMTIFPFGVPHKALEDVQVEGYSIQKGSYIVLNALAVHTDPEIWGDPHEFRPERFLSSDGASIIKHEALIPFGVGKRSCPGEHLAKHNLFIFVSSIFQQFDVKVDHNKTVKLDSTGIAFSTIPPEHKLIFGRRQISL